MPRPTACDSCPESGDHARDDSGDQTGSVKDDESVSDSEDEAEWEDEDEWSAVGVRVRAPDRTTGRGSYNPHQDVKLFSELFPNSKGGEPEALPVREWRRIEIKEQSMLCRRVHNGTVSVPEWVMFTKYGMACTVCM